MSHHDSARPVRRIPARFTAFLALSLLACVGLAASAAARVDAPARAGGQRVSSAVLNLAFGGGLTANVDNAISDGPNHDRLQVAVEDWLVKYRPLPPNSKKLGLATDVVASLAKSWSVGSAGITFNLRQRVKSQWGNTLSADDVKWSIERGIALSRIEGGVLDAQAGFDIKNPVTVLSPLKVRVNSKGAGSLLPDALGFLAEQVPVAIIDSTEAKKHATDSDPYAKSWLATNTASFGPYMADTLVPNVRLTLKANPNYWGKQPGYGTVNLVAATDPSTVVELVRSGTVQGGTGLTFRYLKSFQRYPKARLVLAPQTNVDLLELNKQFEPFQNVKVRQAISLAIDRKALVKGPYSGLVKPAGGLGSDAQPGVDYKGPLPFDLAKAKALMAQAGYRQGFKTEFMIYPGGAGNVDVDSLLIFIRSQLAQIGIDASTEKQTVVATLIDKLTHNKFGIYLTQNQPAVPDEITAAQFFYTPGNFANFGQANFPVFNQLVSDAARAVAKKRKVLFQKAIDYFGTQMIDIPLVQTRQGYVLSKKVCGYRPATRQVLLFNDLRPC